MKDKLEKVEDFINKILGKIFASIFAVFYNMIPESFLDKKKKLEDSAAEKKQKLKTGFLEKAFKLKDTILTKNKEFLDNVENLQNYPIKEKGKELTENLKELAQIPPQKHAKKIKSLIIIFFFTLKERLKIFTHSHTQMGVVAFLLISFGAYQIFESGKDIYEQEYPDRAPASVQEHRVTKEYNEYVVRTARVLNIKVPIYAESVKGVSSITIDFTVRTSTRFARMYLEEFEYKLKDYFFTGVEPVISSFPLEEEGKEVLKEKILDELNTFLVNDNVEGEVLEVDIIFIVGS